MNIVLDILTVVLILVSLFLILIVLAQPSKSDGGMGSALGGGMTESVFGGEGSSALSKLTINASIAFFVLSFLLYLGNVYERNHASAPAGALPNIAGPIVPSAPISTAQPIAPFTTQPAPAAAGKMTTTPTTAPTKP